MYSPKHRDGERVLLCVYTNVYTYMYLYDNGNWDMCFSLQMKCHFSSSSRRKRSAKMRDKRDTLKKIFQQVLIEDNLTYVPKLRRLFSPNLFGKNIWMEIFWIELFDSVEKHLNNSFHFKFYPKHPNDNILYHLKPFEIFATKCSFNVFITFIMFPTVLSKRTHLLAADNCSSAGDHYRVQ